MSVIAGLLVQTRPGRNADVGGRLRELPGIEIIEERDEGFALVLEAESPRHQRRMHERLAAYPGVASALVVFQSTEVEG